MANDSQAVASLLEALRDDALSAADLTVRLQCSQPTLSRWVRAAGARVLKIGSAQLTRYARVRDAGVAQPIPLTRIDEHGKPHDAGVLYTIGVESGSRTAWVHDRMRSYYAGLPWFAADMRPQGFLGRRFPARVPRLGLPPSIEDWNDNHVLRALCAAGADEPGNLILGREALAQFLERETPAPVSDEEKPRIYGELAANAMADGVFNSSAGGEQPKFTTYAAAAAGAAHVIVKFSPTGSGDIAQRWRDLLRAEHHALATLAAGGMAAARSRLIDSGRLYLEVERFDRVGSRGRRAVVSLAALNDEFAGERHDWTRTALHLRRLRLLDDWQTKRIAMLHAFGLLIHNTDMHFGNCAVFHEGLAMMDTAFTAAPAYDMLPMRFAPTRLGLPDASAMTVPKITPTPELLPVWDEAQKWARVFWDRILEDQNISATFHGIARAARAQAQV